MGDAGANLLGYLLGVAAVVGSLKTGAVVALVVPLAILAIPFLDTGFVIAKRLKYRRKPWSADANHFHHRMARIGFSQRKTVAYLYIWTSLMAALAVALRLISAPRATQPVLDRLPGRARTRVPGGQRLPRLRARDPQVQGATDDRTAPRRPNDAEHEIDEHVQHDIETGEFEKVN